MLRNLRHFGHHKELGRVATSQKHTLSDALQPHPSEHEPEEEEEEEEEEALITFVEASYKLQPPIKRFRTAEVQ
jgi:hypothetical protein